MSTLGPYFLGVMPTLGPHFLGSHVHNRATLFGESYPQQGHAFWGVMSITGPHFFKGLGVADDHIFGAGLCHILGVKTGPILA